MAEPMDVDDNEPRGAKRTASEAGLPSEAPRRIKARLISTDVVNKIAAGEIIVAPVNALKEMMENSVDAGATAIEILVKDGGLKLLQITDNGHGIEKDDLPILCERFTTSKLKDFDDLRSIGTYGFRGEALASISHIAHLRVTTKTAGSSCAWQAYYQDGKLSPPKPGQSSDPKPCAGRPGTQITVEDLFYNIPNRRRAFKSPSEEYARILDVVTRYAVHCEHVSFSIKKHGEAGAGFSVAAAASKIDRIKQAHGAAARELIEFKTQNDRWGFSASGYCTTANYSAKRTTILLFINHRSVESSAVKKAIEQAYQLFLPKGGHPFVYLSLEIDPARVDVNVHPTKREVHFLSEDEIIDMVCTDIRERLTQVDTSRTFKTQTLVPAIGSSTINKQQSPLAGGDDKNQPSTDALPRTPASKRPYENNLVRTDSKLRKITSMLPPALTPSQSLDNHDNNTTTAASGHGIQYITTDREQVTTRLSSIKTLRAHVRDAIHQNLTEVFASLTYIGLVDPFRRLAAMQSGVNLYLVDYGMIANELFYQIGITDFGNFGAIQLRPSGSDPIQLKELLLVAAELEVQADPSLADLEPSAIVEKVYEQIYSRREMLREYFSLEVSDEGNLLTIPLLIKNYLPSMAKLPTFLLRLGPFVDWTDEAQCFHTFLVELAAFYVPEKLPQAKQKSAKETENELLTSPTRVAERDTATPESDVTAGQSPIKNRQAEEDSFITKRRVEIEYALEHVLFPAFRSRLLATQGMMQGVVEVANLKGLYRVFERC
ncbi:DNA mismatch repair protein Mlh1 [Lithohypha guttulata]|nr:DNA mismatch repair protein Mlh1 [Lithohypha guttulata]